MQLLRPGNKVHLIGIGGIGLSAIARVLRGWGYEVSGSDHQPSPLTAALAAEGIHVASGHAAENLPEAASDGSRGVIVVVSSAIPEDNPEIREARRRSYPVIKRRELLGELTAGKVTLAVAGSHGKTTTSAMIAWILMEAGLEPTFIVGGVLQNLGMNAKAGAGPHFVIEADEYDRMFLGLRPDIAVLVTLEHDHPDCYPTFAEMRAAFAEFLARSSAGGVTVVCGEDEEALHLAQRVAQREGHSPAGSGSRRPITYGAGPEWDWQAEDLLLGGSPTFRVRRGGRVLGTCALQVPGRHNVLNALAALAATAEVGIEFETAAAALTRFRGTARRFEVKGQAWEVAVVDDYAHHPTEIRATVAAARLRYPGRRLWAVFQPHTYSRTALLLDEFAVALSLADWVLVTPIYAAREKNSSAVSGADVVARIRSGDSGDQTGGPARAAYVESLEAAVDALCRQVQPGDVVLTLGAGDGYQIGERLLAVLQARSDEEGPGRAAGNGPGNGRILGVGHENLGWMARFAMETAR